MTNPTAAMLVIGDEILSGRTREANLGYLATALTRAGINLTEGRVIPDDHEMIVSALNDLRARYDHVFTSGGIGPTHDDITADAVAAAFGVGIAVRDDARAMLEAGYAERGERINEARLRMARIPDGASLIVTRMSSAPGFTLANVHVMAGVPGIFAAMVDVVVPTLDSGLPVVSRELRFDVGEGRIARPLGNLAVEFPAVALGSYPFFAEGVHGTNIVARGTDPELVEQVYARLEELRASLGAVPRSSRH
ncbi:MAG: molybdopterin-binding protein [Brooklawnia sp.]|uniref:competence/damage-inducible protein A n=1 Tax=Brooklawnia sp. TaxID=2699740 RepID=UPI003C765C44